MNDEDESLRIDMDLIPTHEGESESITTFLIRKGPHIIKEYQ